MLEMLTVGSACMTAAQDRRASAIRPDIAKLAMTIRCAPKKFGRFCTAPVAQNRLSSYRPAKKWA